MDSSTYHASKGETVAQRIIATHAAAADARRAHIAASAGDAAYHLHTVNSVVKLICR